MITNPRRAHRPDDNAKVVLSVVSDDAALHGITLHADGGVSATVISERC